MSDNSEGGDPHERLSHARHEPFAWREPTKRHEHDHTPSHVGNGTVNHGPDEKGPEGLGDKGSEELGQGLDGLDGLEGIGSLGSRDGLGGLGGLDGLAPDEQALRRLLHSAVDDIEPRTGTLDHLRRAVPARRARKRQAAVGMAAAALFIGTAIPALVHVSNSGGSDPNTAMAGQSSVSEGGNGQSKHPDAAGSGTGGSQGQTPGPGTDTGTPDASSSPGAGETGASSGADPAATATAGVLACTSAQLGATGTATAPDTAGAVYGTFRVTNVSGTPCTVSGGVTVGATAQGAADQTKLAVSQHMAGDPAAGLPAPTAAASSLVLQPGGAYQEKFAFVPSQTCPATGGTSTGGSGSGGPSPDPSPSQGASTGGSGSTDPGTSSGTTTQLTFAEGTADGSVVVTYTGETGAPSATALVPNACAGTVYYTGVLAAS
ncbi:hypothetical protein ACGFYV_24865 [Streptomyces sp. NPDC048297]|uniref:hypothetical protein n=1 Tax=Streptomyces sp. NPDC048297 TaxID=3365531 RepID=UPI003716D89A